MALTNVTGRVCRKNAGTRIRKGLRVSRAKARLAAERRMLSYSSRNKVPFMCNIFSPDLFNINLHILSIDKIRRQSKVTRLPQIFLEDPLHRPNHSSPGFIRMFCDTSGSTAIMSCVQQAKGPISALCGASRVLE
jgi:hypothetical protein